MSLEKCSLDEAKKIASEFLDSPHIKNPREETTKAEQLRDFWIWNPPSFSENQAAYWSAWKVFQSIDPEAGDGGIGKMRVDMARYFVERAETDYDYWDAVRLIVVWILCRPCAKDRKLDPNLENWIVWEHNGEKRPPKKPGDRARKYHARDGCVYFAMEALAVDGPMTQEAAAAWIAERIGLSTEAVRSIYRKARKS